MAWWSVVVVITKYRDHVHDADVYMKAGPGKAGRADALHGRRLLRYGGRTAAKPR